MTRRERLEGIMRGRPVDRPGVSFYEIGGFALDPDNPDPFNVYASDSWRKLINFAADETDLILMRGPVEVAKHPEYGNFFETETYLENGSRFTRTRLRVGGRELPSLRRRDPDVDTTWTLEHLLKNEEDLDAYLTLPDDIFDCSWSTEALAQEDERIGDRGIVMVDAADPICIAAALFSMADYTVVALTEQSRFHALLEKVSRAVYQRTEFVAREFPGHLWRICGPEYATEPYLPTHLFREYVNRYTEPMVKAIHRGGGVVRLHCHGRIARALPAIVDMGVDAIDPIEPPTQGDVELEDVVEGYGDVLSLYGNVEISDIETMEPSAFEEKTARAVEAGRKARGFVLMPSSSPYGREITDLTMRNYETMVRLATS